MKSYQIHLIRHGETDANFKGQYIGVTDIPLSKDGLKSLKELDNKYKYPGAAVFFTSPLKRCIQTINTLYPSITPTIIDELKECNFGDWEGKTAKQLENNHNFKDWLNNSQNISPPNGESGIVFAHRVCSAFEKLVMNLMKSGTTQAVVVTHGGVITTLLAAYGIPRANPFDWIVEPGHGYSIRITPGLWMRDMVCEVYSKIPFDFKDENNSEQILNIAREAANRAYGDK